MPRRVVLLAALVAVVVSACSGGSGSRCEQDLPGVRPGLCLVAPEDRRPAPTDAAELLEDETVTRSVADYQGKILVLNFWASWCGPCRAEQPELNDVYESLDHDEVEFLGVNIQEPGPQRANALAHVREFEMPYPSLYDPANSYASRFKGVGPRSIPSTILVDPQGRVAASIIGQTTAVELRTLIDELLASS